MEATTLVMKSPRAIDITQIEDSFINKAASISDPSEAKKFVSQITDYKKLLSSSRQFHEYRLRFTRLETYCYIELVRRGFKSSVPKKYIEYIEYLNSLEQAELEKIVNSDDFMLRSSNTNAAKRDREAQHAIDAINNYKCEKFDIFEKTGFVEISTDELANSICENGGSINPGLTYDAVNSMRITLNRMGAVGCGDGIYIDPNEADRQKLESAINIRVKSIVGDLESLGELLKACKEPLDFKTSNSNYGKLPNYELVILLSAMIGRFKVSRFRTSREALNALIYLIDSFKTCMLSDEDAFLEVAENCLNELKEIDKQAQSSSFGCYQW